MAEIPVSDEEMALRRRARRRLVGAVALALSAIVILPLLFDPEPKPLGAEVDIQIPGQGTPFEPTASKPAAPAAAVAPAPSAQAAVSKVSVPPSGAPVVAPAEVPKPEPKPVAKPAEATQSPAKPAAKPAVKPVEKPAEKVVEKAAASEKPASKPAGADAKGYTLQLGVFDKKANADKLADKARAAGFKVQVVEDGGHLRVRVGPVAERARADELVTQLKAKGLNPVLVAP